MALWINRTVVQAPRNGTVDHTAAFTAAAAGSLLVLVIGGPVTSTIPSGWTRHAQGLNDVEISVYSKTATAGENSVSTTHNAANYDVVFVVYEFAAGSTMGPAVNANGVGNGSPGPNLTGLTGTPTVFAALCNPLSSATPEPPGVTWVDAGVLTDVLISEPQAVTDGYLFALGYKDAYATASFQESPIMAGATWGTFEHVAFAVTPNEGEPPAETYTRMRYNGAAWVPYTGAAL